MRRGPKYHVDQALLYAEGLIRHRGTTGPPWAKIAHVGTDADEDRRIKEAIRLYVETWLLPHLREAQKKLTRKKPTDPRRPS